MFEQFLKTVHTIFETAQKEGRLIYNPDEEQLRDLAVNEPGAVLTKYGNVTANSEPMSRAAMFTRNNIDTPFGPDEEKLLAAVAAQSAKEELVAIDVIVGDGTEGVTARLILPKRFAHVAYAGWNLFRPTVTDSPTHQVLMVFDEAYEANRSKVLPEKDITIRNCLSPDGRLVKICRNSNYFGEWKKGVFTGEDWRAKQKGDALFLHAGCRKDTLEGPDGEEVTSYALFVALSANGKTSTTCKVLARRGRERSWLVQDDGGILRKDGSFHGFEAGGLFVKTDALNPSDQIESYYGALKPASFLENVHICEDGSVDFFNVELTSNGRGVIARRDFMHCSRDINAERVDHFFIITRGKTIPAVARLTHEQAAAFMVLGQSMESSAGDPTQAGKIKNVFFYDPFIAGDKAAHANLFYDILKANPHIKCYLLNTGWVGEGDSFHDIRLRDTMGVLEAVLRNQVAQWVLSDKTGLEVPSEIPGVDDCLLRPEMLYDDEAFAREQEALDRQRTEFVEKYPGLVPEIMAVFQPETTSR
ncbi:MAG: phosphoenolpyruvate carboxykinase [Pirellulales bacterium]|nr:phosphoenolpyruvate carboxykinase [Pirellulales bacterium]